MEVPKQIEDEIRAALKYPDLYVIVACPCSPDKFKIIRKVGVGLYSLARKQLVIECVCREVEELGPDSFGVLFPNY